MSRPDSPGSTHGLLLAALFVALALPGCARRAAPSTPDTTTSTPEPAMTYPETRRQTLTETVHGVPVEDPYRWLEDEEDPEVQAWMEAQDSFTRAALAQLPGRAWLERRFTELYYIDAVGTPILRDDRIFLYRRRAGQEKYAIYWKDGPEGQEHLLLDPNTFSEDGSIALGLLEPSPDGSRIAYTLKENNADEATLYVMDVDAHTTSEVDVIEGARYAWPSWRPDSSGFYYTWLPTDPTISEMERPGHARIRYHELGADPAKDPVILGPTGDPTVFLGAQVSEDGRHLLAYKSHGWRRTEISWRLLDGDPQQRWLPLAADVDARSDAIVWGEHAYLRTNWQAPRGRILRVSLSDPEAARIQNAEEIVAEHPEAVLRDVRLVGQRLVLSYMEGAYSKLMIHELDGQLDRQVELPGIGATGGVSGQPDRPEAYVTFTSFTTPNQIYALDVTAGAPQLWETLEVPIDPSPYTVEQVHYPSADGTQISMFVLHRADMPRDGSTPFILYGYGGFGVSMTPAFRSSIYPWLEAGGGFAVANLRGGGEYGDQWHEAGTLARKQNVFDDFIAAAEHLIAGGYTRPERLAIRGGSNGGLLVGAAMTQRPELFGAVVCAVPLLDMLRYHLFGSGKTWVTEYGDPSDLDLFEVLRAYSPYHHVEEGTDYPPTLLLSADSDDRVDPMHARKMTAALQHADTGGEPILLRIESNAGHGGGDMVKKYVASDVDTYAFLMDSLGVAPPEE